MDKKQMFVQVVNLKTGKMFSLPTLYTDRTEACICGQNYVRDRQVEDPCSGLFFRVLIAKDGQVAPEYYLWDDQLEEEEDDFNWDDPACQSSRQQKPFELSDLCLEDLLHIVAMKAAQEDSEKAEVFDDPEEPNYLFEHWED